MPSEPLRAAINKKNADFFASIIHPEDREATLAFCITAVREGRDHEREFRVITKKGKTTTKLKAVAVRSGSAKVKLPKLPKGAWTATIVYLGDAHYTTSKSKAVKVKIK